VDLHPFKDIEVDGLEVCLTRDGPQVVGVPDEDVGVRTGLDPSLARIYPEGLGHVGACDCNESEKKISYKKFLIKIVGSILSSSPYLLLPLLLQKILHFISDPNHDPSNVVSFDQ